MEEKDVDTRGLSQSVWDTQAAYDKQIRARNLASTSEWTTTLLLGLVSECDEVLREINWKRHRQQFRQVNKENLAEELADLSKYVMALWQLWDFTLEDALEAIQLKSQIMEQRLHQEFHPPQPPQPILIVDLDGTIANYHDSFLIWCEYEGYLAEGTHKSMQFGLRPDGDLLVAYPEYRRWCDEFEGSGGYRNICPYYDGVNLVRAARTQGAYIVVTTARPVNTFKRIWHDTWSWLREFGIVPDQLLFEEDRSLFAGMFSDKQPVAALEDNPQNAARLARSGATVWLRAQPYNEGISWHLPNIHRVKSYDEVKEVWPAIHNFGSGAQEEDISF